MEITHPEANRLYEPLEERIRKLEATTRMPLDEMPAGSFSSSNVHSGLYDFASQELYMRYLRDGMRDAIYRYDGVSATVWNGLVNASSKGSYIHENVAWDFPYAQVNASSLPEEGRSLSDPRVRRFVTTP